MPLSYNYKFSNCIDKYIYQDELFGSSRLKRIEIVQPDRKRTKKNTTVENLSGKQTLNDQIVSIDRLKQSSYFEGTIAMGYILQITEEKAVVSLPAGITGTISLSNISDVIHQATNTKYKKNERRYLPKISELISLYQPIRCFILGLADRLNTNKKTLLLSLRASLINRNISFHHLQPGFPLYGCISSIEDHGYIVSVGLADINCFLSLKRCPKDSKYIIGQPVECIVESVNEYARSVSLSTKPKEVIKSMTFGSKLTLNSLIPGMLVNAVIDKVLQVCIILISIFYFMYVCMYLCMYVFILSGFFI